MKITDNQFDGMSDEEKLLWNLLWSRVEGRQNKTEQLDIQPAGDPDVDFLRAMQADLLQNKLRSEALADGQQTLVKYHTVHRNRLDDLEERLRRLEAKTKH